jgi:hypothetical protein
MILSPGSRGGCPGKEQESMNMAGESSASRKDSIAISRENQTFGRCGEAKRPFAANSAISQAVIGDT